MTTEKTIDKEIDKEIEEARASGDWEAWRKLQDSHTEAVRKAIRLGMRQARADELPALEQKAIDTFVGQVIATLEDLRLEAETSPHETQVALGRALAERWAGEALVRKLMAGYEAEWRVREDGPGINGLVAQSVDRAVETLRPYWEDRL